MFLSGNFAPVRDELDSSNLETTGKIPSDLKGMFVRVGPNPKFHPIAEYHWYARSVCDATRGPPRTTLCRDVAAERLHVRMVVLGSTATA